MATRVSSPEFIGRQAELTTLNDAVTQAATGTAGVVLVGGDAGIGKTRLITEVEGFARRAGFLVLEGGCVSLGDGGGLPFAPIVEALRRLPAVLAAVDGSGNVGRIEDLRTPATAELGRLLPDFGASSVPEQSAFDRPEWTQARIFEALLSLLGSLGKWAPVMLVLEDLHWADGSTRDVTSFLARNARTERLVVVGTYRTDELHRRHPLRPWLSEIERLPRVQRVELRRFGHAELEAQVTSILDHAPPPALIETVERRTEGNPFFVEELLASGAEQPGQGLPPTLRDVLLGRVTALPDEAQRLLGVAAVAGRTVDSELLAVVAGQPEAELEGAIRDAMAAQILVSDLATGAYGFRHALLAEAVYDDLLPSERRRLHAAYAEALEARPTPEGAEGASHLSALAHHASAAHESVRALRAWVLAARAAARAFGFSESMRAYEQAIDLWDTVPADDRPTGVDAAALYDEAALAFTIAGRPDRAVDFARMACELIDREQEPDRWAAANVRLSRALWVSGIMDEGLAILESTAAAIEGAEPSSVGARVLAGLAGAYMLRGEHSQAVVAAKRAIELARATKAEHAEAHAMNTLGVSTVLLGRSDEGLRITREAFDRTRALDAAFDDLGRSFANLTSVLLIAGHPEESLAMSREGIAWARSVGAWGGYGRFISGNALDAAIALGRWNEAQTLADELVAEDAVGLNRVAMIANAGRFLARRGRLDKAAELLEEGRAKVERLHEAQFTAPIFVGIVDVALARGDLDLATTVAADGIERLQLTEDRYYVAELLAIAARAEADRAERARAGHDQPIAADAERKAQLYATTLDAFAKDSPDSDAYGGWLVATAVIASAEAIRATGVADPSAWQDAATASPATGAWMRSYTNFRLAEALLASHGSRRDAEAALSDAFATARDLTAAPLVGWIEALARRARVSLESNTPVEPSNEQPAPDNLGLTNREREVLALVAEGYTNRRIAEMLFISESTAGVHVSNILGKLGVATRTEAATTAMRLGIARPEVIADR